MIEIVGWRFADFGNNKKQQWNLILKNLTLLVALIHEKDGLIDKELKQWQVAGLAIVFTKYCNNKNKNGGI